MAMDVDVVVIGAGVIGLSAARACARAGFDTILTERSDGIGRETSSRNSEVIHAGIYYPEGSLKARACRAGRDRLYEYCRSHAVAYRQCGKLIVAVDEPEIAKLEQIAARARANDVADLEWLGPGEVAALEPEVRCVRALWSPSTGIIDSHGFMLALQGDFESAGGQCAFETPLIGARAIAGGLAVRFGGAEPMELTCRHLVNSAGLGAQAVARAIDNFPAAHIPAQYLAKGNYFNLAGGRQPFRRLIYPAPVQGGLGVHVTIDLAGQARFGPDVEWLDDGVIAYDVDPGRADSFYAAVRRYWPGLADGALVAAYAGVRPKLTPRGAADGDFRIDGPRQHGFAGVVNLFGIESPGLTASLALADLVVAALE
jgi:L-2-hydroxyglutarate oxidase LhgO